MIPKMPFLAAFGVSVTLSICSYAQLGGLSMNKKAAPARLLSAVNLYYDGSSYMPNDSTFYRYHGGRSGYYDDVNSKWVWDYDTAVPIKYTGWTERYMYSKEFDGAGNCTAERTSRMNTDSLKWQPESETRYSYDAANNVSTELQLLWNPAGTMDPLFLNTYAYSPDNSVSEIGHKALHVPWGDSSVTHYDYDVAGRINFIYYENYHAPLSLPVPVSALVFAYNAAGDRVSQTYVWWTGSNWDTSERYTYSDITDHLPGTVVREVKDTVFKKMDRAHYTYNEHGMPLFVYYEWWKGGAWVVDTTSPAVRYHYEEAPVAVDMVPKKGGEVRVYPVPAQNTLSVDVLWEEQQSFTVFITDMQGRVGLSMDLPVCKDCKHNIPIADVPEGNYTVTIQGMEGRISRKITIAR